MVTLSAQLPGANEGCGVIETRKRVEVNAPPAPAIAAPERIAAGGGGSVRCLGLERSRRGDHGLRLGLGRRQQRERRSGPAHFAAAGSYTVRLATTDDAGVGNSRAELTKEVVVTPPPVAGLAAPLPLCPGEPHAWSVAEDAADLKASWLFDDAVTASGPTADFTFDKPGVFPVSVTLDDGGGLDSSRRTEEVYVRVNQAPVAEAGADRIVCPGETVVFDAGPSADVDGKITTWRWTFSDGVVLEGPHVERVFDTPGARDVALTVTDDSGSACASGSDAANVLVNAAPLVDAGPDRSIPVGAANDVATFDAGAASDPDGQGVMVSWDFGDETKAQSAVTRHRYVKPGDYTVTVEARDSTGLACGVATDSATVHALARE